MGAEGVAMPVHKPGMVRGDGMRVKSPSSQREWAFICYQ
jgi:hypothetical protein